MLQAKGLLTERGRPFSGQASLEKASSPAGTQGRAGVWAVQVAWGWAERVHEMVAAEEERAPRLRCEGPEEWTAHSAFAMGQQSVWVEEA